MSMNIHLSATRTVSFKNKAGKRKSTKQTIEFPVWQTPTKVSYAIEAAHPDEKLDQYIKWIMSCNIPDHEEHEYAEQIGPIDWNVEPVWISTKMENIGQQHITEMREWIFDAEENGYTLDWWVA